MLSIVFGEAFEDDTAEGATGNIRVYSVDGRHFVGHETSEIVHVCDKACAETVLREAGNYVQANDAFTFVSLDETRTVQTGGNPLTMVDTADVQSYDAGDDSYVLCGACKAELHRDDEAYEAMFGRKIDDRS